MVDEIKGVTKLLNLKETADIFSVTTRTIRRWVHDGRLTPVKLGTRTLRFSREEINRIKGV
jgi:excisionase family DNA binding protein